MYDWKLRIMPLFALLILFSVLPAATASDAPHALSPESVKRRIEREKRFLLRSSDEIGRTLALVNETADLLIEQVEAVSGREAERRTDERLALLDWYQRYAEWLKGMSDELEQDGSAYFAKQGFAPGWARQYEELVTGNRRLGAELGGTVHRLEEDAGKMEARMRKVNTAVAERRVLVDKDDLELARELWPSSRVSYDSREAVYKELSDEEVLYLRNELRSLGEQQKYLLCLMELGRYELAWLDLKAKDFIQLSETAKAVDGADPGEAARAYRNAVRTYEAGRAALTRRSGELDAKMRGITRTGSLKTLDRLEELSRYYDHMKSRYESQSEWLRGQIGSYRADLIEIGREL
jgi:hypothetical protein